MDHPQVRQIERTGYTIPIRNPEVFSIDPITCTCGCRAVVSVHGNNRCADCAHDEYEVTLL